MAFHFHFSIKTGQVYVYGFWIAFGFHFYFSYIREMSLINPIPPIYVVQSSVQNIPLFII